MGSKVIGAFVRGFKRLTTAPFAAVIGMLAMFSFANFVVNSPTSVARLVHDSVAPVDFLYMAIYGVGGFLFVYGMARNRLRPEFLGLAGIAAGSGVQAFVYIAVFGWPAVFSAAQLLMFTAAATVRAWYVFHGYIVTTVRLLDEKPVVGEIDGVA
jgi:hypothetical protein